MSRSETGFCDLESSLSHLVWSTTFLVGGRHASAPNPQLRSPLKLPGCKRLHLSFGPSWAARWSGRAKTQIASGVVGADARWLRTPRKFQPAPSAQTTSSAHGLVGWSLWVGACGVASSNRLALARRLRDRHLGPPGFSRSFLTSRSPLTPDALTHHPYRPYPTHPQSYSETAWLQALASEF